MPGVFPRPPPPPRPAHAPPALPPCNVALADRPVDGFEHLFDGPSSRSRYVGQYKCSCQWHLFHNISPRHLRISAEKNQYPSHVDRNYIGISSLLHRHSKTLQSAESCVSLVHNQRHMSAIINSSRRSRCARTGKQGRSLCPAVLPDLQLGYQYRMVCRGRTCFTGRRWR